MAKYMDSGGLSHFMSKVKEAIAATVTGVKGNAESSYRTGQVNITPANIGAVAKSGDTMTGNLTVGDAGTNALPTCGYRIIDMRNVSSYSPNDLPSQVANYFFDQNGEMPTRDGKFYGVFSMKGWSGNYGAWQIAGIAQDSDSDAYRNSPLYVRGGNRSTWGPWRKLFDEKNKSTECQTTNPFAPGSLSGPYISKIDNAFYAADKRWAVSATLNGSAISAGNVAYWFNGDYESRYQVAKSGTCVITMDFTNTTYFPGYPYGYILVSFYYNEAPASVSGRVYCNYQSHGVGWHDISFAPVSDSGTYSTVYRSAHQGYYNISQLEITVVASSSVVAGISQIEMHLDRPYSGRNPFLSKYAAETLYYSLTAPKFIGDLQGKADSLKDAGNNSAITAQYSGSGITTANWFAAWNGYKIAAISAENAWTALGGGAIGKKSTLAASDIPSLAISKVTNLQTSLDAKAPLASPAFTGTPTAPTAATGTNTTQVATTAFVKDAIDNLTGYSLDDDIAGRANDYGPLYFSEDAGDTVVVDGPLPVEYGGTGVATIAALKTALGLEDSGWQTLPLNGNAFKVYSNDASYTPMYRKVNGVVEVTGGVSPLTAQTLGETGVTIGTLPTGFRPASNRDVQVICQGSGRKLWLLRIDGSGVVSAQRMRDMGSTSYQSMSTTEWMLFTATFLAG